jgi:hypothetical protein
MISLPNRKFVSTLIFCKGCAAFEGNGDSCLLQPAIHQLHTFESLATSAQKPTLTRKDLKKT